MDHEEIILLGEYKNFKSDKHYYVEKAQNSDIAGLLVELSNSIELQAYQFSGIDTKKIDSIAKVEKGLTAVVNFLKSFKRDSLLPAANNKSKMLPIAESYLINQLLKNAQVNFKPNIKSAIKPETEKPEDQIAFIGNCKGWFAAKKLSIDSKTEDWEVSAILSGINYTLINKSFDFADLKGNTKSGRKSLGNLTNALSEINENDAYAVCKTCEGFGYFPYATPQILMDEYPGVKPPKVKGRKAKD